MLYRRKDGKQRFHRGSYMWQQSRKGEIYKVERGGGGMITRSLVGCLFRLEHPKGGWQTRLVIYFQVIASDIYTTRLISTTYIYTQYYYDSPEFVYGEEVVIVTDGSSFYSHCYAKEKKFFLSGWGMMTKEDLMRPWERRRRWRRRTRTVVCVCVCSFPCYN